MQAGASLVTHLFNAMSPFGHREPGMVGAAPLAARRFGGPDCRRYPRRSGLDGSRHPRQGASRQNILVTDAKSTIGSHQTSFTLNGRTVYRAEGRLTLEDGTLAGADIDMISSVRILVDRLELELEEALKMAGLYPAIAVGSDDRHGRIGSGSARTLFIYPTIWRWNRSGSAVKASSRRW